MRTASTRTFLLVTVFLLLGPGPHAEAPGRVSDRPQGDITPLPEMLPVAANSRAGEYEDFEATAYCVYGITYSGVRVKRGIVAADPKVLPIGSVIEVLAGDYTGIYTVMDTGGLIKGRIIDIYMPEYEEAIQFGRQQVRLRVLRRGWAPATSDLSVAG